MAEVAEERLTSMFAPAPEGELAAPGTDAFCRGVKPRPHFDVDDTTALDEECFKNACEVLQAGDDAAALCALLVAEFGRRALTYGARATRVLNAGLGPQQRTLLMEAAALDRARCAETLLREFGCRVNAQSAETGDAALHCAARHGARAAALALLMHAADASLRNNADECAQRAAAAAATAALGPLLSRFLRGQALAASPPSAAAAAGGCDVRAENAAYACSRKRRRVGGSTVPPSGRFGAAAAAAGGAERRALAAAAGVGAGARAADAEDPFAGTAMAPYIVQALATGRDPFMAEGGGAEEAERDRWQLAYYARHEAALREHQQQYGGSSSASAGAAAAAQRAVAGASPSSSPPSPPLSASFRLVVKASEGVQPGKQWALPVGSDLVIGRNHRECQIVVKEVWVSKKHARLVVTTAGPAIYNLKAKHGIIVAVRKPGEQGPHVTRYPVPVPPEGLSLMDGDEISIGKTVLVLHQNEPPPAPPQPTSVPAAAAAAAAAAAQSKGPAKSASWKASGKGAVMSRGFQANTSFFEAMRGAQATEDQRAAAATRTTAAAAAAVAAAAAASVAPAASVMVAAVAPAVIVAAAAPAGGAAGRGRDPAAAAAAAAPGSSAQPSSAAQGGPARFVHAPTTSTVTRRPARGRGRG